MMHQAMSQDNQPIGNQQAVTQQMMLCPVKLVYDTQILMQPGDQIQPNQTIFINPQNPPPWIQNRMQNQVLYVQQVPNNYYQHQIDPNSVYLHNYQYPLQQQILTQAPQEQRPVQISNLTPNVIQGLSNVHNISNVQNIIQSERLVERHHQINSFGQIPQQITPNRQVTPNVGMHQVHNQIPQQTIEIQRPVYMSSRPQLAVNANVRQQVMNTQNTPNIQQNVRQTFATTTNQQRPVQMQNNTGNMQRIVQPNFANPTHVHTVTKVLESVTSVPNVSNNKSTNITTNVPNLRSHPNYAYRPIQPRPQYRHNVPNIGILTQPIPQMQNIASNSNIRPRDNRINNTQNTITTANVANTDTRTETQVNRKRKSESPDEIQKKVSIISPSMTNTDASKQRKKSQKDGDPPSNRIFHIRSESNDSNHKTILQLTNNGAQIIKLVDNGQQTNLIDTLATKPENSSQTNPTDKEKLVRNTVYTQARGRLLSDKEILPNITNHTQDSKPLDTAAETVCISKVDDIIPNNLSEISKGNDNNLGTLKNQQEELNKSGIKGDNNPLAKEAILKTETTDEQQILTHVLDGYVIQESNMAFPIRRPLKERIIYDNTEADRLEKDLIEDFLQMTKPISTVKENKHIELSQLPLQNLQLDSEKSDAKNEIDPGTPFSTIQPATVKSWTVDNLAKHLTKYGWTETVSILQEHEIDGESLFLVSKTQLEQIGIREEHAGAICEFVKH